MGLIQLAGTIQIWGSVLKMSSAILQRPMRRQTEVVNRCLEAYLRFPLPE